MDHVISISPDGTVRTLYTDKIELTDFGPLRVERASNVEWINEKQGWAVQFADGTWLQSEPPICAADACCERRLLFESREDALAAEVEYLQARL